MPAKYYIYAGGRWCEVDTRRGRMAGFRHRARFFFLRGGKLEVGRSAAVLRALRALATGAGSAARDYVPLLGRRPHRSRRESARAHGCCSQHLHHSRCDLNANELGEKLPPTAAPATERRKRKRSTSDESREPKHARQCETERASLKDEQCQTSPQKAKLHVNKIHSLVSSSEDNGREKQRKELTQKKKIDKVRGKEEEKLVASLLESSSEDSNREQKKQCSQKAKARSKDEEKLLQNLLQSSSEDSSKEQKKQSSQKAKPGPSLRGKDKYSEDSSKEQKKQSPQKLKLGTRVKEGKLQRSSDVENTVQSQKTKSPQKKVVRDKEEGKLVQSLLESSSSEDDDQVPLKTHPTPAATSSIKDADTESGSSESSEQRQDCKELVIDDSDVRVLRRFLARGAGGEEMERFDNDEEYKTRVFYKLNPLVVLKRCGPLEQLLLQRLSLQEFAGHLGLRSVADVTPEKRYRMRHSTRQARNTTSVTSDSENEKEIAVQPKRRQLWNREKDLFNNTRYSQASEIKVKPLIHRPHNASDSETEVKKHIRKHLERRASTGIKSRREDKKPKTNKDIDSDSIQVDESSSGGSTTDKTSSNTDANRRKSRRRTRGIEENESVIISDETDSEDRGKTTSKDESVRKSRRRTRRMKKYIVSAEDSDVDENRGKSRHRARGKKEGNTSVIISDESDSDDNEKRVKSRSRARAKSKNEDDNESVVISDGSDSSTDENMKVTSARRTRSQGPKKRVLREHNKSVVTSDDTDSNSHKNRAKSRARAKERTQSKKSNTDENRETRRTRSTGPDRALKEQNRPNDKVTKEDKKASKEEDNSTERKKNIRSPIKGAGESRPKEKLKADWAKKDQNQTSNKTEDTKSKKNKPGTSSRQAKETNKDQDKSVISESDDAFEMPKISPKKNKSPQKLATNRPRTDKGRFLKQNQVERSKMNEKVSEKEIHYRDIELNDKNKIDNLRSGNETDREKSKVKEKDRTDKDNKENSKSDSKGKENDKKAAVARNMFIKPVKFKKSSVANGREYTSLEDHAIVAWISNGNRERMVNGNTIWRELEKEYHRLTTQKRTWHSLRNRYLRYILPALGALALPPQQVSRLRAAAAVGKIKSRYEYRRNSIFNAPRVRSAAAAGRIRIRPVSGSDSDEKKESSPVPARRPAPPRVPPSPSKSSPAKATSTPLSPPRSARLRPRSSVAATPPPKKKRIHRL